MKSIAGGTIGVLDSITALRLAMVGLLSAKPVAPTPPVAPPPLVAPPPAVGPLPPLVAPPPADNATTGAKNSWQTADGKDTWTSVGGAVGVKTTGSDDLNDLLIKGKTSTFTAAEAVAWIKAQGAKGNLRAVYDAAKAEGIDMSSLDALMGWPAGTSAAWATEHGLPTFALGGLHHGGARLVGERGPELAVTGPERIYSFDHLMRMASGAAAPKGDDSNAAAQEIRQLRDEQRRQTVAMAALQTRLLRLMERWEVDGMPETRVTTA